MNNRSHFLEGILLGAAVGALFGLLFAPQSGAETRKKLKELKNKKGQLLAGTKEKTDEMISKTMYAIETGFNKIGKMIDKKDGAQYDEIHG